MSPRHKLIIHREQIELLVEFFYQVRFSAARRFALLRIPDFQSLPLVPSRPRHSAIAQPRPRGDPAVRAREPGHCKTPRAARAEGEARAGVCTAVFFSVQESAADYIEHALRSRRSSIAWSSCSATSSSNTMAAGGPTLAAGSSACSR